METPWGPPRGLRGSTTILEGSKGVKTGNSVDYVPRKGVIHRDLMSANILLGNRGETRMVDWAWPMGSAPSTPPRASRLPLRDRPTCELASHQGLPNVEPLCVPVKHHQVGRFA